MCSALEFILRSLAAVQGGNPLPPDVAHRWERGFWDVLSGTHASLDDALGLRPGSGTSVAEQYKLYLRDELVCDVYAAHHKNEKRWPASIDIADGLDLAQKNRNDPRIDDCYRDLFDRLAAAGIDIPSQGVVYDLLRNTPFRSKRI